MAAESSLLREFTSVLNDLEQFEQTAFTATSCTNVTPEVVEQAPTVDNQTEFKPPKGSRDYDPEDMVIRENMMQTIKDELRKCGCSQIETPVFELRHTLYGQYGEDEKLIYELADQGGELLCLRYDLTVPLARYVAMNRKKFKGSLRAARIGRVYRRDQPRMTKGRMREFYQCDLDIVRFGRPSDVTELIIEDVEVLNMMCAALTAILGAGEFQVRVNNRKLFDCILKLHEVPEESFRPIGSAVDKLDKMEVDCVVAEMVQKGLSEVQARGIIKYTEIIGQMDAIQTLLDDEELMAVEGAPEAMYELQTMWNFLTMYGWTDAVVVDMSMVRGLDYYTGMILEAVLTDPTATEVGSIGGGGRYDKLVNRFAVGDFPCVGASIGFERIFAWIKAKQEAVTTELPQTCTQVLVARAGAKQDSGLLPERIQLQQFLRSNNLSVEILPKEKPSAFEQFEYAESWRIPFVVFIGGAEVENGTVNVNRKYYNGQRVMVKGNREGVYVGMDGKFVLVKNKKGKVEKMKKGNIRGIITSSGEVCALKETIPREELPAYVNQYL